MLCQHCGSNEASYHFVVRGQHNSQDIHLCPQCAHRIGRQYYAYLREGMPYENVMRMLGYASETVPRQADRQTIPEADEVFSTRRRLRELQVRLQQAVDKEEYEQAALLRDQIQEIHTQSVQIPIV